MCRIFNFEGSAVWALWLVGSGPLRHQFVRIHLFVKQAWELVVQVLGTHPASETNKEQRTTNTCDARVIAHWRKKKTEQNVKLLRNWIECGAGLTVTPHPQLNDNFRGAGCPRFWP